MAPDLSEKLLGIDIDGADRAGGSDDDTDDDEAFVRFVFVRVGEYRFALSVDVVRTVTDPPTALTRVPRTPPAIEGLMDLRGEITAVIDPRIHFPTTASDEGDERLVVFDRPSDQQSAAIRVDDVIGVEAIPESNVIDAETVSDSPLSGDALEHPLVVALVTQEHDRAQPSDTDRMRQEAQADDGTDTLGANPPAGVNDGMSLSSTRDTSGGFGESIGDPFEIESATDADADESENDSRPRETVLEATALVDIDRLLLASGQ